MNIDNISYIYQGHSEWILSTTFSPDGSKFLTSSQDNTIKLWDTQNRKCIQTIILHCQAFSVQFFSSGDKIAAGCGDFTIYIIDLQTQKYEKSFQGHNLIVTSIAITPDNKKIFSGSLDKTVRVWDIETESCIQTLSEHSGKVENVAISRSGKMAASVSRDRLVKIWDTETLKCLKTLEGHDDTVTAVSFSPDNENTLITSCEDSTIKIWNIKSKKCVSTFSVAKNEQPKRKKKSFFDFLCFSAQPRPNSVFSISISCDGKKLASGCEDGSVKIWDLESKKCIKTFVGHEHWVTALSFSPNNKYLISGSRDETIKMWDISNSQELSFDQQHNKIIKQVKVFKNDASKFLTTSEDKTIKIWDSTTHKVLKTLKVNEEINHCELMSQNNAIITVSGDSSIKIWDLQRDGEPQILQNSDSLYKYVTIAVSSDERYLLVGDERGFISKWDLQNQKLIYNTHILQKAIIKIYFLPNSRQFVACDFNKIKICDIETGKSVKSLHSLGSEYESMVKDLIVLNDEQKIVSISYGNQMTVWDTKTLQRLYIQNFFQKLSIALDEKNRIIWTICQEANRKNIFQGFKFNSKKASSKFAIIEGLYSEQFEVYDDLIVRNYGTRILVANLNKSQEGIQ